jgi:hypothetical protein
MPGCPGCLPAGVTQPPRRITDVPATCLTQSKFPFQESISLTKTVPDTRPHTMKNRSWHRPCFSGTGPAFRRPLFSLHLMLALRAVIGENHFMLHKRGASADAFGPR